MSAILHVEDDANDALFLRRAFAKARLSVALHQVADGQEAIDYLSGAGAFADRGRFPVPSLILLDLKLPALSGFDVLFWIRQSPALKDLRVFILTSSDRHEDSDRALKLGAERYIIKTYPFEDVVQEVRALLPDGGQ